MPVTGVNTIQSAAETGSNTASTKKTQTLDQDAFLKLFIAQLRNQNPLEPMKDTEFIAQMAQFSALEQMTQVKEEIKGLRQDLAEGLEQINETLAGLRKGDADAGQIQNAIEAVNLLGKRVLAQAEDKVIEGIVESVKNLSAFPVLMVAGRELSLSSILEVLS